MEISDSTILSEQLKDKTLSKFYKDILDNKDSPQTKNFFICPSTKILMFVKDPEAGENATPRVALPKTLRYKALSIAHVSHYGISKTFQFLSGKYFWKGIYADTVNFVQSCTRCATTKSHKIPQAPFLCNPVPEHPGDYISLDLVGPFINGFYILTCIDHFSRYLHLFPLKTISSQNIIDALFKYITVHGRPSMIQTDLGTQFTAQIFDEFNEKFGIRLIHTTPSHPQGNAISERINQSIKSTILALQQDGYNFHNSIQIHQMMYNSSIHSSTKASPNSIHFGREISSLYDTMQPNKPFLALDTNRNFFQLMEDLERIYQRVYDNLLLAQNLQNSRQQCKAKVRNIKIGDTVYMKSSHTFKPRFTGPFTVMELSGPVHVIIQRSNSPSHRQFKIHINRLWISPPRKQHLIPDDIPTSTTSISQDSVSLQHQSMDSTLIMPSSQSNDCNQTPPTSNITSKSQNSDTSNKQNPVELPSNCSCPNIIDSFSDTAESQSSNSSISAKIPYSLRPSTLRQRLC